MPTNQAYLSANSYLGLVLEANLAAGVTTPTRGTASTGSYSPYFIPVTSPQVTPMQTFLRDEALRGSPNLVYDQVQGVRHDEYDFKSYLYADTFPMLLLSVLGGNDITANVTGSAYSHTIGLYNDATQGSQPLSYSIMDFDGANYFLVSGAQAESLNITFGAEASADGTIKFFGNPYVSSTTAPAPFTSFSYVEETGEHPIPAWDTTIVINGTTYNYISTGEFKIDRKTKPIFTMGNQGPYVNFAGPVEVTGKFTAVVNSTTDTFSTPSAYNTSTGQVTSSAFALGRSPEAMTITLSDPNDITSGTNHSIVLQLSAVQFHDVKRTRGKEYTEVEVSFTASGNTSDIPTGTGYLGYSPIKTVTTNAQSSAYQTGY